MPDPTLPKSWRKLLGSPFVTDTLFPLIGHAPPVVYSPQTPHSRDAVAKFVQPDTLKVFDAPPSDYAITHEVGHMLDAQGRLPSGFALDPARRPRPGTYAATNEDEHVAEAFARAVASGRHAFADSTAAEKDVPGTIDVIRWLMTQKPFGGNP